MSLNPHLQELVDNDKVGFEDVFELYATLLVNHIREITNEMIEDEGVVEYLKHGTLSVEVLTQQAVDFGNHAVPEMIGDTIPEDKLALESWLEYLIRHNVETHVAETKAFQTKVV